MAIIDALADMPVDAMRQAVANLATENMRLRRLFIDSASMPVQQALRDIPEACAITPTEENVVELWDEYRSRQSRFDAAPFDPAGDKFRMFPGGVTIWSGFPGTGKTTLLRQLACHLLREGRGVFVASLEEDPRDALVRLMMTAAGSSEPTAHQRQWFLDAYGDRLRLWGMVGLAKAELVIGSVRASARDGIRHAIIDSLTCLDVGASDWDGQRGLANDLCSMARQTGIHVHLVAHPRKPSQPGALPDISDIAGSSDLGRLVDNVVFIRRAVDDESQRFEDATQMRVIIRKQRHGTGMCGSIDGWFHRQHRQFSLAQWWSGPTRYLPDDAYGRIT